MVNNEKDEQRDVGSSSPRIRRIDTTKWGCAGESTAFRRGASLCACLVLRLVMRSFFARNIDWRGRIVRAVCGVVLIVAGLLLWERSRWLCFVMVASGGFTLFEAARGWCLMRAC